MRKLKILLYGDVDLNIMDGSAVWVTSMANMLSKGSNVFTDVLLKAKVKNKHLLSEIEHISNVHVISADKRGARLGIEEAVGVIEELDRENQYHCIIVRGFDLVARILSTSLISKTIPYITNFTHSLEKMPIAERNTLKDIYTAYPYMFVQTPAMKELLQKAVETNGAKFQLLLPMIPDYKERPSFQNNHNTLVYTGKFAKDWYTEEIIGLMKELQCGDETISLHIAGDKFQGDLRDKKEAIINQMASLENVHWAGAVSRSESLALIKKSDIGIGWRSPEIDNDNSVELSTKLLEYGRLGKPILLRKTKIHQELLGGDYELFVDSKEEFIEKTKEVFHNPKLYKQVAKKVYQACEEYTFTASYNRLKNMLWSFQKEKIKLLFAGHDFKFAQAMIDYFTKHSNYEVRLDQWKGHKHHGKKQSEECLAWADIIFCEWGLGNAVWYSQHKQKGQVLIIRMHGQELKTNFPHNFSFENINRIIAISPFIYEEFHRISRIPRDKMKIIYNMVDTKKYDLPKMDAASIGFHLGICGILPRNKRLDRALDIIEKLWEQDRRYKLFVKSKLPKELPWVMNQQEERVYYDKVFKRIENAPWRENVIFDKHGNDVEEWFQKVAYILSTSDFESFHLAPMEGMASGSIPLVLQRLGVETIYPVEYIFENEDEIVRYVQQNQYMSEEEEVRKKYPALHFDKHLIIGEIESVITEEMMG